jgi:hypothetical protein
VPLTSDINGQMQALTVLTPIVPGAEAGLRDHLAGLGSPSPLARLGRTHFGRWVIVPRFVKDPEQPKDEDLGCQYLLFTSTFDGPLDTYLQELCRVLATEAREIWGRCIGCPPGGGAALERYLLHNKIPTGLFFTAYPDATVKDVQDCLELRDRTIAFAVRAQTMNPAALRDAFLEECGP